MQLKQKVRAFTIMEVTVTMLIAAIVIMIVYTAYRIIGRSYADYDRKNKLISELVLADKILKKDFNQALDIVQTLHGILILMPEGQVDYAFDENYIIRSQNELRIDTFKLRDNKVLLAYKNRETRDDQSIDNLLISCKFDNQDINLNYHKTYSAEQLFKQDIESENR